MCYFLDMVVVVGVIYVIRRVIKIDDKDYSVADALKFWSFYSVSSKFSSVLIVCAFKNVKVLSNCHEQ